MENISDVYSKARSPVELVTPAEEVAMFDLDVVRRFDIADSAEDPRRSLEIRWVDQLVDHHLVVSDSEGDIHVFDAMKNKLVCKEHIGSSWLYSIDAEPEKGQLWATGSLNSKIHIMKADLSKNKVK